MKRVVRNGLIAGGLLAAVLGAVLYLGGYELRRTPPAPAGRAAPDAQLAARGAYLARAGDCMACHTARGGAQYAGGRAIATPFGRIVSPNITSDVRTGIGGWSADDFWRALHHGKSRDGRLLYPAFPYTNYTRVTRADSDALHAYFMTVPAVNAPSEAHELRFPYNQQLALAAWRALYFRPAEFRADPARDAQWNRGAYLVEGLGHCSACHSSRNALGATTADSTLAGGVIPMLGWYAPSLDSSMEAGLGQWSREHIVALLKTGVSGGAAVFGPMAEVVRESLQHLTDADLDAMAVYLKSIPEAPPAAPPSRPGVDPDEVKPLLARGAVLYKNHCATCHGDDGAGQNPGYPALAGNRNINMAAAINPIRVVLNGGFPPGTAGNPRPYGMPPFAAVLNDEETAAVVSYIRSAWGNGERVGDAAYVSPVEVNRLRSAPLD